MTQPVVARQTWSQFRTKSSMGMFQGVRSLVIRFHWKFWRPLKATGGQVFFGPYAEYDENEIGD